MVRISHNIISQFSSVIILIIIFFLVSSSLKSSDDLDFILSQCNSSKVDTTSLDSSEELHEYNPISFFGMGLIRFYQLFLSTQDEPVCNFTLSCSNFGVHAIQQKGFFIGVMLTADRLTRCNSLTRHEYHIDKHTDRAIDNVPKYFFNK